MENLVPFTNDYFLKLKSYVSNFMLDKETLDQRKVIESFEDKESKKDFTDVCKVMISDLKPIQSDMIIGGDVFRDIELFENLNDNYLKTETVFDKINFHNTVGGKQITKLILSNPIMSCQYLNERQRILKDTEAKLNEEWIKDIKALGEKENDVLWLYQEVDNNLEDLYNMVYFRMYFLNQLNQSGHVLTGWNVYRILISPLIGLLSPVMYFVLPFIIIRYKFPMLNISFKSYLKLIYNAAMSQDLFMGNMGNYKSIRVISYIFSLIFYFQGVFNSFEISRSLYKMSKYLTGKINNVVSFLQTSENVIAHFWDDRITKCFLKNSIGLLPFEEEQNYIRSLKCNEFSLFSNFGEQLKTFKFINKEVILSILSKIYVIDSFMSISQFKEQNKLSYTRFVTNTEKPLVKMQGLWHPCLCSNVVKNNIELGGHEAVNNVLVTGPNAGGKSTFVKSVLVSLILSQTICVSVSDSCEMTPFHYINSQISIPDCKGYESLFQAELFRCKKNLDILGNLSKGEFSFVVFDELLSSTNPIESISAAYAILKKMSSFTNSMLITTTHFIYLTKLAKQTQKFKNMKMHVLKDDSGNFVFPYVLSDGISKQTIAIELLEKKGFDEEVIQEALRIKEKLV